MGFCPRISQGFGSVFGSNLVSKGFFFVHWFVGLQRLVCVVSLGILNVFWKILGFYDSEPKLSESVLIYIDLGFVVVLERNKEVSLWFYLVLLGDLIWIFGIPWTDSVLCWFFSKSGNKPVISSSSSQTVKNPWILHPLLLKLFLCDRAGFIASGDGFGAWIAETQFNDDDSVMNLWELQWISSHCAWILTLGN